MPASEAYSATARALHWLSAILVAVMFATGLWMTYRGDELELWDATTNTLYSLHKSLGLFLLAVVCLRLGNRLLFGAPADPPSLTKLLRVTAHTVHWLLYALLLAIPLTGWLATSMFPALDVFGSFKLPAIAAPNRSAAEWMFEIHETLGDVLVILIALHIAGAMVHYFVLKDGIVDRMWPTKRGSAQ